MKQRCYLCGADNPSTRDHVPPKGFFPPPRPSNLITLPCCGPCNAAFASEDDYFRLILSALIGRSPAGDHIWEQKVAVGTLKRRPGDVDEILRTLTDVTLQTEDGPCEVVSFEVDRERVHRYAIRLTKGLLAHHFPSYEYSSCSFEVRLVAPTKSNLELLAPCRDLLQFAEKGDRVFRYYYGLTDTERSGLWMLTFYDAVLILVFHTFPQRPN